MAKCAHCNCFTLQVDENGLCKDCAQMRLKARAAKAAAAEQAQAASGQQYIVRQLVLPQKVAGSGSADLSELQSAINAQAAKGYRLHSFDTAPVPGGMNNTHLVATMVFEKL